MIEVMGQKSIRFGVANNAGQRGATWKCWTETGKGKNDIYLTCRELGGTLKASMHESGRWHIAFEKKFYEDKSHLFDSTRRKRFLDKWPRPSEIAPGITLAFRIIVPVLSVSVPINSSGRPPIVWIPSASKERRAVEVAVLITFYNVKISNWPGKQSMGTKLVGTFTLENEDSVWVVYREIDQPHLGTRTGKVTWFKPKEEVNLEDPNLRMIVFGHDPKNGSRWMMEFRPRQKEND